MEKRSEKVWNSEVWIKWAAFVIIQTESGEIRRNRRHLAKIPESVKDNDKITSETAPDNSSKSDNENKDIPDNLLTRIIQSLYYAPAGRPAIVPIEGAVLFELDNLSDQTDYRDNLKSTWQVKFVNNISCFIHKIH